MTKLLRAGALAWVLLSVPPVHAFDATSGSDCATVDLRTVHPLMLRDQGDVAWCYANSTADHLQFYFRLPEPISAADIAIEYNRGRWPRMLRWFWRTNIGETGFARTAMWTALEHGYCPESSFPSDVWTKRYLTGEKAGQTERVKINAAITELLQLQDHIRIGLYAAPLEVPFVYDFPGVTQERFIAILRDSRNDFVRELRDAACEKTRRPFPGGIRAIGMRVKGRRTFTRINALLDSRTPVDIDFFAGFLMDRDHYRRGLGELHSTLLMGRRYDAAQKECTYLIKNSWGPECGRYDSRHQCEHGYIWVSESSLYRALMTYVYVQGPLEDDGGPDLRTESAQ